MYKWIVSVLFFGAFAMGIIILFSETPTPPSKEELAAEANTIKIVATNWKFDQEEYKVKAGTTMTVELVNQQGIHGIAIEGLGIELKDDQLKQEVTFDKPGEYKIICNVLCGTGHLDMVSKIVVE
jgi:cytochrome c oxidase subunit 2